MVNHRKSRIDRLKMTFMDSNDIITDLYGIQ